MIIDKNGKILDAWWYSDGPMVVVNKNGIEIHIGIPYDTEQKKKQVRIDELKKNLDATDFWGHKYIEGEYTEEEWAEKKAQRATWRNEIRERQKDFVMPTLTQEEIDSAIHAAWENIKSIIEQETGKEVEEVIGADE